jgi:hypothetical protein
MLREEHRLKVFENKVLWRKFEPKRDEVMGGWRKLQNKELHDLYSLPDIIRMIKLMWWVGHVAQKGVKRNAYKLLAGKPEGKRPLGRPRPRWVNNIRIDLVDIGLGGLDWIGLVQDRYRWRELVSVVMNLHVP